MSEEKPKGKSGHREQPHQPEGGWVGKLGGAGQDQEGYIVLLLCTLKQREVNQPAITKLN
jgi:hypothetical protein